IGALIRHPAMQSELSSERPTSVCILAIRAGPRGQPANGIIWRHRHPTGFLYSCHEVAKAKKADRFSDHPSLPLPGPSDYEGDMPHLSLTFQLQCVIVHLPAMIRRDDHKAGIVLARCRQTIQK